MHYTENKS